MLRIISVSKWPSVNNMSVQHKGLIARASSFIAEPGFARCNTSKRTSEAYCPSIRISLNSRLSQGPNLCSMLDACHVKPLAFYLKRIHAAETCLEIVRRGTGGMVEFYSCCELGRNTLGGLFDCFHVCVNFPLSERERIP